MALANIVLFVQLIVVCFSSVLGAGNFASYFEDCYKESPFFDSCIKDALNNVRPFFKPGVPEYNLPSFDPFFAPEVLQVRGGPLFNYKLKLKNVYESGWTISEVTKFTSDLKKNYVRYSQFFPDKQLEGDYEFIGSIFGNQMANKGKWNLTLYDYTQTTTIRKPTSTLRGNDAPLKVNVEVETTRDMKLHISNLLGGNAIFLENMLDRVINSAWQPGFVMLKPLINDLVSTAFTEIFNKAFKDFPFNEIIK